jgi:hypothetical protein
LEDNCFLAAFIPALESTSSTFASSEYCSGQFFPNLESTEQMWFLTGTCTNVKDNRRYIPVHELSRSFSPTACQILPVAHALTGCDTTSSLFRIGKKSVFKLLRNCPEQYSELATGPLPVFFEGIMTSYFLQNLICSCKGKVMCDRSCVCNEQNMCCTELCPCQGSDFCQS